MHKVATILLVTATAILAMTACGSTYTGSGTVVGRDHSSMWVQTNMFPCGKSLCPQTIVHPAVWSLKIKESDKTEEINVDQSVYNSVSNGTSVTMKDGDIVSVG